MEPAVVLLIHQESAYRPGRNPRFTGHGSEEHGIFKGAVPLELYNLGIDVTAHEVRILGDTCPLELPVCPRCVPGYDFLIPGVVLIEVGACLVISADIGGVYIGCYAVALEMAELCTVTVGASSSPWKVYNDVPL